MRAFLAGLAILSLVAPVVAGLSLVPPDFGEDGPVSFAEYTVPQIGGAPEPTIGIPWDTDSVFYHAGSTTIRARFVEDAQPQWEDVTAPYQVPTNVDPMLHVDPQAGRIWAGGLHGPCSIMMYSDDDGESWLPTANMCSGVRFDHQSIGSGRPALPVTAGGLQAYYCGQFGPIACATSIDGGVTWLPFQEVPGPCNGFHGHIRTDPTDGFAAVPVGGCGGDVGFISTADGGLTWRSNVIPDTEEWTNGFDPSLQFTQKGGWLYYGMASEFGVKVALSKDHGETWEPLGGGMGVEETAWLDIGQFHDPPIVAGTFADVQAGDDERVAVSFMGLEGGPDADLELLNSNKIYRCDDDQDKLVWHYYAAFSYDAGQTWTVEKLTQDPVQVGGVYDVVVDGPGNCRNLLDFNDMDIDSTGRVYIAWADGCIDECAETAAPDTEGYRTQVGKLFRQVGGKGLFAEDDAESETVNVTEEVQPVQDFEPLPAVGVGVALAMIALLGHGRRRVQ